MGNSEAECLKVSGNDEVECPTVEIKIKTLDSQTYTMRVDKCVPVPALKEQIATVTGVLSEQQRLICRGKVLKDDQLLSAYHVEDGHTLHLVVRQPPSEINPDTQGTSLASSLGNAQASPSGPGVFVGTLNLSEPGDESFSDLNRFVSAVIGSIGLSSLASGSEGIDINGFGGLRNSTRQQNGQGGSGDQASSNFDGSSRPADSMQPPVIADSLTTLSHYLTHLREEFDASVGGQTGVSPASGSSRRNRQDSAGSSHSTGQGGLPTPQSLAEVMLSTRQLVVEQAAERLLELSTQLENQRNVTDSAERTRIQSLAWRSGTFFQNLGALLLELGRTTMTLRMGQTPDNAVVNAGPAVFVSSTGPNPIMVQPQPFQAVTGIGAVPLGSGISAVPMGSGFTPRSIDIRIRTGAFMPSNVSRRDATGSQNPGQAASGAANAENSNQQGTQGTRSSTTRGMEVRVVPIRTVVAAVPASVSRAASLGRAQHVGTENANNSSASQGTDQNLPFNIEFGPPNSDDAGQQNIRLFGVDVNRSSTAEISSRVENFFRTLFPGEQIEVENVTVQDMNTNSAAGQSHATQNASASQETQSTVEDGVFLSNILHHIMPIISQNSETASSDQSTQRAGGTEDINTQTSSTQAQGNTEQPTSSRRQRDPRLQQPGSKRQKRE